MHILKIHFKEAVEQTIREPLTTPQTVEKILKQKDRNKIDAVDSLRLTDSDGKVLKVVTFTILNFDK